MPSIKSKLRDSLLLFICGLFAFCLFPCNQTFAQSNEGIPDKPSPPRLVNNLSQEFPNFLSNDEEARLESKLTNFAYQTSNQIIVVIVDDLGGLEPYAFAAGIGHKWGVGQSKTDNGIVILIKPTQEGGRQVFIAPGYGLEGVIPDATAKQIVENELKPRLKEGKYYEALDASTDVLMSLAKGEYNSDQYANKGLKKGKRTPIKLILLALILIIFFFSRRGGGGMTIGRRGSSFWTGALLGSMMGGRSSGGGGFGGGGGGGFGGFGGGGFGGGGAGGSW